jgi:hypothetical protein
MANQDNTTATSKSEAPRKRRRGLCLLAAVATLAICGTALAQDIGPPPPMPQYHCNPPWMPPTVFGLAYRNGFMRSCNQMYQSRMQQWRDQMEYWRALHDYRMGGN